MFRLHRIARLPADQQKILDDLEAERTRESLWRKAEAEAALKRFSAMRGRRLPPWQSPESRRAAK
jgi:hypothetical protein